MIYSVEEGSDCILLESVHYSRKFEENIISTDRVKVESRHFILYKTTKPLFFLEFETRKGTVYNLLFDSFSLLDNVSVDKTKLFWREGWFIFLNNSVIKRKCH